MKTTILVTAAYVCIYYLIARSALLEIKSVDPGHFDYSGARSGASMKNSLAVGRIIFDSGLPKSFYPSKIKVKLILARIILATAPLVFLTSLLLIEL